MTIDDRLRDWAAGTLDATTPARVPVERFADRSRARVLATVVAAVTVVALAAVLLAVRASTHDRSPGSTDQPVVAPSPAPEGYRPITFHGLTVDVPSTWPLNAMRCGLPTADTVVIDDGASDACGSTGVQQFSTVDLYNWHEGAQPLLPGAAQQDITVDGVAATRQEGTRDGLHVLDVVVPSLQAEVVVRSRVTGLPERIVSTAQITTVDANGCPARSDYVAIDENRGTGSAGVLVPGRPTSVAVCRYLATFLERGTTVADATGVVSILDSIPTGLSETDPSTYSPSVCRGASDPGMKPELLRELQLDDEQQYVIRVAYADRPPLALYARIGQCGALGITNGTRTAQRTEALWHLLVDQVGTGTGFPSEVRELH